jgi:opacity protein-like surface antigen
MPVNVRAVLLSLAVVCPAVSLAGGRIDVEGGAMAVSSNVTIQDAGTEVTFDTHAGGSWAIGGYWIANDHLEVGGQYQQVIAALSVVPASSLVYNSVTAGARYQILPRDRRVRPWLVGQLGWYNASGEVDYLFDQVSETGNGFGFNVGGGIDFQLSKLVSLGADLRYHHAVGVLGGLDYMTTMVNVAFHLGGD